MSAGFTTNPMMLPLMGYIPLLYKVGEALEEFHKEATDKTPEGGEVRELMDGCFGTVETAHRMFLYIMNEATDDPTLVKRLCELLEPVAQEIKKKDEKEKEDRVTEEMNKALYNTPTTADKYRKEITDLQEGIRERMLSIPKTHEELKEHCKGLLGAVDEKLSLEGNSNSEYKSVITGLVEVTKHIDAVIDDK